MPPPKRAVFGLGNGVDIDIKAMEANQQLHAYTVLQPHTKIISFEPHLHAPGAGCASKRSGASTSRRGHRLPAVPLHAAGQNARHEHRKAAAMNSRRLWLVAVALASLLIRPSAGAQSLSYSKGQNISPAYEGWEQRADGVRYFPCR